MLSAPVRLVCFLAALLVAGNAFAEKQGNLATALGNLYKAFNGGGNSHDYIERGNTWSEKGEFDRAIEAFDEAIRLDPQDPWAYSFRGIAWGQKGEYDRAIDDFNEAIRLDPNYASAYNNRGIAWGQKGEYDRAIDDFSQAIRLDPQEPSAYYDRAVAWKHKGNHDRAIDDSNEVIRLDPECIWAYYSRGAAWGRKGQYDKAIADFNAAIRLDPQDPWGYNGLARLRATCLKAEYRNRPKAIELATTACELTNWQQAEHLDTLALAYAVSGDYDKAIHWQTQVVAMAPTSGHPEYQRTLDLYNAAKAAVPAIYVIAIVLMFIPAFALWRLLLRFTRKFTRKRAPILAAAIVE